MAVFTWRCCQRKYLQATKVVFKDSPAGLIATGVEFVSNGQTFNASAKKEVILSAGNDLIL